MLRSPQSKPGPAMIDGLRTASRAPRLASTPRGWRRTSLRSHSLTSGRSWSGGRRARTKRPTSARYGRPLAVGSRLFWLRAQTRSTPATCISTLSSMALAVAIAFASNDPVGAVKVTRLVDMLRDRHLASGDLCCESEPLSQGSRESSPLSVAMRGLIAARAAVMSALAAIDADIGRMTRASEACRRLMTIPGVGQPPFTARAIRCVVDGHARPRPTVHGRSSSSGGERSPRSDPRSFRTPSPPIAASGVATARGQDLESRQDVACGPSNSGHYGLLGRARGSVLRFERGAGYPSAGRKSAACGAILLQSMVAISCLSHARKARTFANSRRRFGQMNE
jgi:hypothetical protein